MMETDQQGITMGPKEHGYCFVIQKRAVKGKYHSYTKSKGNSI